MKPDIVYLVTFWDVSRPSSSGSRLKYSAAKGEIPSYTIVLSPMLGTASKGILKHFFKTWQSEFQKGWFLGQSEDH
jgi:hypothetical protein